MWGLWSKWRKILCENNKGTFEQIFHIMEVRIMTKLIHCLKNEVIRMPFPIHRLCPILLVVEMVAVVVVVMLVVLVHLPKRCRRDLDAVQCKASIDDDDHGHQLGCFLVHSNCWRCVDDQQLLMVGEARHFRNRYFAWSPASVWNWHQCGGWMHSIFE